jgi:beta-lactamase regulating signal transducer with metallopeptidase domain/uncharacterized membrane protein
MDFLVRAAVSNAVIVALLAPIVLAADRLARRPALAHRLWLILLIKLVTPPLILFPAPWPAGHSTAPAMSSPPNPAGPSENGSGKKTVELAARETGDPSLFDLESASAGFPSRLSGLAERAAWQVTFNWGPLISGLWLSISGLGVVWTLNRLIRIHWRLRTLPPAPADVQDMARDLARRLDLKAPPRILFIAATMSPALWAMGSQALVLVPAGLWARLDQAQRAALLAHELAHLRRRDHWIRPLELLVRAVYWWLPVVWWARQALRSAEEQCCDAWVISTLPHSKRAYARTLLDAIDFLVDASPRQFAASTGFGTVATLKLRLNQIMKGGHPPRLSIAGSIAIAAIALLIVPLAWQPQASPGMPRGYRVIDLGPFEPIALNNMGQVVGSPMAINCRLVAQTGRPVGRRGHVWESGTWTELAESDDIFVTPTDINDRGQVTGWYEILLEPGNRTVTSGGIMERRATYSPPRAFRTAPNRWLQLASDDLGTLGGQESRGLAINNAGQVAGLSLVTPESIPSRQQSRAFRTSPQEPINPLTDQLEWFDTQSGLVVMNLVLNNLGDVVATTDDRGVRWLGYHADPGRAIESNAASLGPDEEPGTEVRVTGINDHGQVIARVSRHSRDQWNVPVSFPLGPHRIISLESDRLPEPFTPKAINNNGLVLGSMKLLFLHPYSGQAIYDGKRFHRIMDLLPPELDWMIVDAVDINDQGQVIGRGLTPYREYHGFLLDPVPDPGWFMWLVAGTALTGVGCATGRLRSRY